jgi:hypothetical protein
VNFVPTIDPADLFNMGNKTKFAATSVNPTT